MKSKEKRPQELGKEGTVISCQHIEKRVLKLCDSSFEKPMYFGYFVGLISPTHLSIARKPLVPQRFQSLQNGLRNRQRLTLCPSRPGQHVKSVYFRPESVCVCVIAPTTLFSARSGASLLRQASPVNGHTMGLCAVHCALSHTGVDNPEAK
ncbi:hypothetical protein TNCV_3181691 [Trichonephila clavipes]|nr:hypothetical protein TNCV_3181691 [Trichonephila clavipes]